MENNDLLKAYGLDNLRFYMTKRGRYCCKYVSDQNVTISGEKMERAELIFLLNSLSIQQGKVYFEDYDKECVGIDELKTLYLPMMLSGL